MCGRMKGDRTYLRACFDFYYGDKPLIGSTYGVVVTVPRVTIPVAVSIEDVRVSPDNVDPAPACPVATTVIVAAPCAILAQV